LGEYAYGAIDRDDLDEEYITWCDLAGLDPEDPHVALAWERLVSELP
jgi:hypothetical protein